MITKTKKRQHKFTLSLDNYKTARERAKKAVASSNVDTEEEVLKVRKKKVPSKYWSESEGKHAIAFSCITTLLMYKNHIPCMITEIYCINYSHPELIGEYEIPTEKRRKMSTSSQKPVSLPKPPSCK